MEAKQIALELVDQRIEKVKELLSTLRKAKRSSGNKMTFKVFIHSYWFNEGEKDIETIGESLEETCVKAAKLFKEKNKRSDIQGQMAIYAVFSNGLEVPLPKDIIDSQFNSLKN